MHTRGSRATCPWSPRIRTSSMRFLNSIHEHFLGLHLILLPSVILAVHLYLMLWIRILPRPRVSRSFECWVAAAWRCWARTGSRSRPPPLVRQSAAIVAVEMAQSVGAVAVTEGAFGEAVIADENSCQRSGEKPDQDSEPESVTCQEFDMVGE
jgi:hypothetical protein